tara:strand:+ start:39 stop:221 length:183 start_codon:yes stop_codon:yes gene_type:complete
METMWSKLKQILKDFFPKGIGISYIFKLFTMEENTVRQENATVYLVKSALLVILREKNHL